MNKINILDLLKQNETTLSEMDRLLKTGVYHEVFKEKYYCWHNRSFPDTMKLAQVMEQELFNFLLTRKTRLKEMQELLIKKLQTGDYNE